MKIAAFTIDGNGTFAQDVPAFAAALAAAGADIVLVPGTSRARRSIPAAGALLKPEDRGEEQLTMAEV